MNSDLRIVSMSPYYKICMETDSWTMCRRRHTRHLRAFSKCLRCLRIFKGRLRMQTLGLPSHSYFLQTLEFLYMYQVSTDRRNIILTHSSNALFIRPDRANSCTSHFNSSNLHHVRSHRCPMRWSTRNTGKMC